jgi:streptogramin lyase
MPTVVTILAGTPATSGFQNGAGAQALFSTVARIALDNSGNVFVADTSNHVIRKVDSSGNVTTLAGTPPTIDENLEMIYNSGYVDGPAADAKFSNPNAVAVDSLGNVYVSDDGNHLIRKINTSGVVSTVAGIAGATDFNGVYHNNGPAAEATFYHPVGIAVDTLGNVYVTESGQGYFVRKISTDGNVTTVAGMSWITDENGQLVSMGGYVDGPGAEARFNNPTAIIVDSTGNLFIADTGNNLIRKIDTSGVVSTYAPTLTFSSPEGIAIDNSGNIVVADSGSSRILTLTSETSNTEVSFSGPLSIAIDSSGTIIVSDNNYVISKITVTEEIVIRVPSFVSTLAGIPGTVGSQNGPGGQATFTYPIDVAIDNAGNIYVADATNSCIRKIDTTGIVSTFAGIVGTNGFQNGPRADATFNTPYGVALDSLGNVYVAEYSNHCIRKIDSSGNVSTLAGTGSPGSQNGSVSEATFNGPTGVVVDSLGNIYVSDHNNHCIRKVDTTGNVSTLAGILGTLGFQDGPAAQSLFNYPWGVAVDSSDNLYVSDHNNHRIRKIDSTGNVTTLAGSGSTGSQDGPAAQAMFDYPIGVAIDTSGNVYVGDYGNQLIRKIDTTGIVSTVAGIYDTPGSQDGPGAEATFNQIYGIAVDSLGNIYVADHSNSLIRKISFTPGQGAYATTPGAGAPGVTSINGTTVPEVPGSDGQEGIGGNSASQEDSIVSGGGGGGGYYGGGGGSFNGGGGGNSLFANIPNFEFSLLNASGSAGVAGLVNTSSFGYGGAAGEVGQNGMITLTWTKDIVTTFVSTITTGITQDVLTVFEGALQLNGEAIQGAGGFYSGSGAPGSQDGLVGKVGDTYLDYSSGSIYKYGLGGSGTASISTIAGNGTEGNVLGPSSQSQIGYVYGTAKYDSGNVYFWDTTYPGIYKINSSGILSQVTMNTTPTSPNMYGLDIDAEGNIYLCDHSYHCIWKVSTSGDVSLYAGTNNVSGFLGDGEQATSALLFNPYGIKLDGSGNLYITDHSNSRIRKVDKLSGIITTVVGTGVSGYSGDGGQATDANIQNPLGNVCFDTQGNLYFGEAHHFVVRKVDKITGIKTPVAGKGIIPVILTP